MIVYTALVAAMALVSFSYKQEIDACFLSFTGNNLTAGQPDRLPATSEKTRTLKTEKGSVEVTRVDGYRILYNNDKNAPFVNLKVELSDQGAYESDQKGLIDNLRYLNAQSSGMETKELIELSFNGYKITGLSRGSIESGSTPGSFVLFPGKGVTVYFYFNNLRPGYRHFGSLEDYKKLRNQFMEEYTRHLASCQK